MKRQGQGLRIFSTHLILTCLSLFLVGCASSDVSRSAANQVDDVYNSATQGGSPPDPVSAFHVATQATKGAVVGGVAGAGIGSLVNGIGVIPGAVGGAIFGAAAGAYIDTHTNWRDKLENAGGQVLILGDQVKIIVPSSMLFHSMTADLNPAAYQTLDMVAQFLSSFDKIGIKVAAFTNATGPARINQEISQEQANAVARYLWLKGVNGRLMTAVGYGGTHLVRQNTFDWNGGDNYRIEITAEKV